MCVCVCVCVCVHSPSQKEVGHKGNVVVSVGRRLLPHTLQSVCIASAGGQEEEAPVILGMMETLHGQPKLALGNGQVS